MDIYEVYYQASYRNGDGSEELGDVNTYGPFGEREEAEAKAQAMRNAGTYAGVRRVGETD